MSEQFDGVNAASSRGNHLELFPATANSEGFLVTATFTRKYFGRLRDPAKP